MINVFKLKGMRRTAKILLSLGRGMNHNYIFFNNVSHFACNFHKVDYI